eukprot:scaffold19457_cov49-Attheya_sp.AAC.5
MAATMKGATFLLSFGIFAAPTNGFVSLGSTGSCARHVRAAPLGSAFSRGHQQFSSALQMGIADSIQQFLGLKAPSYPEPCVMGDESLMAKKTHEYRGYWQSTPFIKEAGEEYELKKEIKFFDSNTGKLLFVAPKGRSFEEFVKESVSHGWPSFRDDEVVWENVRCLPNGEAVSVDGTHLGHNLPDFSGSRYCINLVSVAGNTVDSDE